MAETAKKISMIPAKVQYDRNVKLSEKKMKVLGRPIVSTSANISGEDTPRNLAEISREIIDGVDYVVNPKFEGKPTGKASSILLFNEAGEFRIIRE